jgi:hypothetical protein
MEDLKELPTEQLLELLAKYTGDYTRMAKEGAPHVEYYSCEIILGQLQAEINFRRATLSSTKINFETDTTAD